MVFYTSPFDTLAPLEACDSVLGAATGFILAGVCLSVCPGPSKGTDQPGALVGASMKVKQVLDCSIQTSVDTKVSKAVICIKNNDNVMFCK